MTLTKAYVLEFDGYEGTAVDYLDNQIEFSRAQIAHTALEYIEAGSIILIEDDGMSIFIDLPEGSFHQWESEQKELFESDTSLDASGDAYGFEDDQF